MLRKALFKLGEVALIVTLTVSVILVMGNGSGRDLGAGETATGDPCSSSFDLAGDANGDDAVTITDALRVLNYLFNSGDDNREPRPPLSNRRASSGALAPMVCHYVRSRRFSGALVTTCVPPMAKGPRALTEPLRRCCGSRSCRSAEHPSG